MFGDVPSPATCCDTVFSTIVDSIILLNRNARSKQPLFTSTMKKKPKDEGKVTHKSKVDVTNIKMAMLQERGDLERHRDKLKNHIEGRTNTKTCQY